MQPQEINPDLLAQFRAADADGRRKFLSALDEQVSSIEDPDERAAIKQSFAEQLAASAREAEVINSQLLPQDSIEAPSSLRFDIGRSKSSLDERLKINQAFPEGNIKMFKDALGQDRRFVEFDDGRPAVDINPPGLDLGDVEEFAGSSLNLETALSLLATRGTGGLLKNIARTSGAAAAGNLADSGVEAARGFENRTPEQIFSDAALAAGFNATGDAAGQFLGRGFNTIAGRGSVDPSEAPAFNRRADAARVVAGDPHLQPIGVGQSVPGLPAILRGRASQFSPAIQIEEAQQGQGLRDSITNLLDAVDEGVSGDFPEQVINGLNNREIEATINASKQRLTRSVRQNMGLIPSDVPATTRAQDALTKGIFDPNVENSFRAVSREDINRKYAVAEEIARGQDIFFDLNPTIKVIEEITEEFRAPSQGGPIRTSRRISNHLKSLLDDISNIRDGILLNNEPLKFERDTGLLNASGNPLLVTEDGELVNAFGFLRNIQVQLGDYFGSNLEISQADEAVARRVRGEISKAIDNAKGGSGEFQKALKAANKAVQDQHEVLDSASLTRFINDPEPGIRLLNAIENGQVSQQTAHMLKRSLPKERFQELRGALLDDIISQPNNVRSIVQKLDTRDGLGRIFLGETEMNHLKAFSNSVDNLDQSALNRLMTRQTEIANRGQEIFQSASLDELDQIWRSSSPSVRKDIQAGLTQFVLEGAEKGSIAGDTVDPQKVFSNLQGILNEPVMRAKLNLVLDPSTVKALENRALVASVYGNSGFSRSGAGIAAGSVGGSVTNPTSPTGALGGLFSSRLSAMLGRALTNPEFKKWAISTKQPIEPTSLRMIGVISTSMVQEARREKE